MKQTLMTLILILAAVTLAAAQGPGPEPGPGGKWWNNPMAQEKLNLTPDQSTALSTLHDTYMEKLIDLRAEVQKQRLYLSQILEREPFVEAEALRQAESLNQARMMAEQARTELKIKTRALLTAEQWKKIEAFRQQRKGERRDEMRERSRDGDREGREERRERRRF